MLFGIGPSISRLLVSVHIISETSKLTKPTAFRYNSNGAFVGTIEGPMPTSSKDSSSPVLLNCSFLATELLHHNWSKGDTPFLWVTGNDPGKCQGDMSPLAQTLHVFSHFTLVHTKASLLLVDYQDAAQNVIFIYPVQTPTLLWFIGFHERGVLGMFVLIDPQAHSLYAFLVLFVTTDPNRLIQYQGEHGLLGWRSGFTEEIPRSTYLQHAL